MSKRNFDQLGAWPGPSYFVSGRKYFPSRIVLNVTGDVTCWIPNTNNGLDFDIYVVFILIIRLDNARLYLEKTHKTADAEVDWDIASDVTSYIQHNTWREIFASRNK